MIDLETQKKIDGLIDAAYKQMTEIFTINEEALEKKDVYQTITVVRGDMQSYIDAYVNYYMGVFEGIFITLCLDELERYPSPEEKSFIQTSFQKKWEEFIDTSKKYVKESFDRDLSSSSSS